MKLPYKELCKYEVANELGLLDKLTKNGWTSLSAKETGLIGSIVKKRLKENPEENESPENIIIENVHY